MEIIPYPFLLSSHLISTDKRLKVMFPSLVPFVLACESDSGVFLNTLWYLSLQSEGQNTRNTTKLRDIDAELEVWFCLILEQEAANFGHSRTCELTVSDYTPAAKLKICH